ncbi:TPA: hypothetical protein QDB19_005056 [Burkholderia vietnamiensis]|nr:hypothetical protein [Burkholderia vietnamiensis]HDR8938818.1 hypothetical protein [Burkholderia vietnamiensis]HDR9228779.1 hypothetical protein [Burkholderia vietnamiensis]HDR9260423.1 hypothetical protein [Burkholderia vietnamiensis]
METVFAGRFMTFDGQGVDRRMTLREAAECVRDREVAVALLDVVGPDEIDAWWNDRGFPDLRNHQYHRALNATGITLGQLQRSHPESLVSNIAEYFGHAGVANIPMRDTRFIQLFMKELGAETLQFGNWSQFMLATKREYPPFEGDPFSFAPHCDCIDFGRDVERWPFRLNLEQLGAFITIQKAENEAGFVLWNIRPESRRQLDQWADEYAQHKTLGVLDGVDALTVRPRSGQLCVFNSRNLHAVERCSSLRRTIGTFLVYHEAGWKLLH